MKLSNATLDLLPGTIAVPTYDRDQLRPGILHIGLGNFHRAHQAWYLHKLMQMGEALDWAIIGAGVRPGDAVMREKLLAQDCLTTLIALDPGGISSEVTGPMLDFVPVVADNAPLIAAMSGADIRIVALTVTEGGYYVDAATGGFDATHPDIVHDAAHPDTPRTAFGAMIAALRIRRDHGHGAFTALSCDNLQGNGAILRQTVVSLARLSDPDLADWINSTASFPNSMVDCIVPATGPAEIALAKSLGVDDAAPVTHEYFRQWVIEDSFCAGRPDWDKVGATFSDDVHAYEAMKIRILNAGHQVIANAGEVLGIPTIADCMADPQILAFFRKVQTDGIAPYVAAVPEISVVDYVALVERRFSNPEIRDTTRRVAFDGASRHSGFVLPVLRDALAAQGDIAGLALVEALWARMCAGTREDDTMIAANDPLWPALHQAAQASRRNPGHWIDQRSIYGDLGQDDRFRTAFTGWLDHIWQHGTRAALAHYLQD